MSATKRTPTSKKSVNQVYGTLSSEASEEFARQLELYGPRNDFAYRGDCALTEAIRAKYELVAIELAERRKVESAIESALEIGTSP